MWEIARLKVTTLLWRIMEAFLLALRPLVKPRLAQHPQLAHRLDRIVAAPEDLIKKIGFNCQMCGQCILHSTGLTCPMNCPKNLRNGPCGGVRPNGHCEVKPEMKCVWVLAYERSQHTPWANHLHHINPPVNRQLTGTSSWINLIMEVDQATPAAWKVENGHDAKHA